MGCLCGFDSLCCPHSGHMQPHIHSVVCINASWHMFLFVMQSHQAACQRRQAQSPSLGYASSVGANLPVLIEHF